MIIVAWHRRGLSSVAFSRPVRLGIVAVAAVTMVAYRLHALTPRQRCCFCFVIVIFSLYARLATALIVSVVAIACLDYFFTPPLFRVRLSETLDLVALSCSRPPPGGHAPDDQGSHIGPGGPGRHRGTKTRTGRLQEQASLLDLTHDALLRSWRGRYDRRTGIAAPKSCTAGSATKPSAKSLTTAGRPIFRPPLRRDRRDRAPRRAVGRGARAHQRDGTRLTVASRWSSQQDAQRAPDWDARNQQRHQ